MSKRKLKAKPPPRVQNSGYSHHGASRNKPSMLKWIASSKSPHEDISENLDILRTRSRDLYAGSPIGRGAVDRILLNAIGSGLKLNVRIDPELLGMSDEDAGEWARKVEAEFDYWASSKDSDYSRMMNFYELQVLVFRSLMIDGECLAIMPDRESDTLYPLSIMLIESERLATPLQRPPGKMIDEGVELDASGNPCAYWIANRNPESELMNQPRLDYHRIKLFGYKSGRRQILHLMLAERINQHRGVPLLAPVIEPLKQLSRYTDAELMAAVVSGMYAVFFEHEPHEDGEYSDDDYATEQGLGGVPGLEDVTQEEMYGLMMDLPEGVKPVGVSPGRPNQNFSQFVENLVKQIGGALGIPAELLFMQFTASYSASRGALLEAWKLFKFWRTWFASNFCQMVYEEWLTEAVLLGRIDAPGYFTDKFKQKAYAWAEWVGPAQGQLNPLQEVKASVEKLNANLSTYQREAGELTGEDWDLILKQRQREERLKKEAGLVVPDKESD